MNIEEVKLSTIVPYERNAKKHPKTQIEQIKESILRFGNNDPIAIDENNVIIEGHGRYLALKELGYELVPVIRLSHLSDQEKRAYILAHNKLTLNTDFDIELLQLELQNILDVDMSLFGFSASLFPHQEQEELPLPPVKETPQTKIGQLYQLGPHRLMCGDVRNPLDMKHLIGNKEIDLYVTDPPYNVAYVGKTKEALTIQNDAMEPFHYRQFLTDCFYAVHPYIKPGGAFYIWHADTERLNVQAAVEAVGWDVKENLVWVKNSFVMGRQDYHWQHEPCLYGWKPGASHYFLPNRSFTTILEDEASLERMSKSELIALIQTHQKETPTTILRVDRPTSNPLHPTMKPISLIERLILNSSREGELVLDTFGGSGSTLLACEETGRISYTMEIDPGYVDVIINRWEEMTDQQAKLIE